MNKIISIGMMLLMTLSIGCIDQSTPVVEEIIEEKLEFNIMSVTVVQGVANIKIKNTGNVVIEDMYIGVVGISDTSVDPRRKSPPHSNYINELVYNSMINGEHIIVTDVQKYISAIDFTMVEIQGKLIHKEYIGVLNPGDICISETSLPYGYDEYVKIAWVNDTYIMY